MEELAVPQFNTMFVSYFTLVAAVGRIMLHQNRQRAWIVPTFATTMIAAFGCVEVISWILSTSVLEAIVDTAMSNMLAELLKAYLIVDLVYSAFWHPDQLALLDGWIHHIVYIIVMEKLQHSYQIHCARPLWIMEIPAAIRAWTSIGILTPQVGDRWFGATFVAFRIVWPAYVITQILAQTWVFNFIMLVIVAHTGWFAVWMRRRNNRPLVDGEL